MANHRTMVGLDWDDPFFPSFFPGRQRENILAMFTFIASFEKPILHIVRMFILMGCMIK